ncbi:WD_REPEATS_REGION domain-containing protein [Pseudozyma hubeiensis]|nr:WD_REPEATS_REGION domain-containing protein [Pseudozyma hubeiensis]
MVGTRKRTHSDGPDLANPMLDRVELDQQSSGPSCRSKRIHHQGKVRIHDAVSIWRHGSPVADLHGDTIDPDCCPSTPPSMLATSLDSSRFLLRTGLANDALAASHLPFGGTTHTLGQSMNHRYYSHRRHAQKSQFRYRESFAGHTSCVNALAISRGQGRWLASGGDDQKIHVRDLFVDLRHRGQTMPLLVLKGHQSNIFSLDWSAENKCLFSTGNDSQILYYDVEHSQMPIRGPAPSQPQSRSALNPHSIGAHDDSVPELSAHPTNPNLLLSCDDGGDLKLVDIRIPHDGVSAARSDVVAGFSSVQWNPNASDGNTFAAATCGRITGSTRLYDVRQCFSSDRDRPLTSKDAVLSYHTALIQNSSTRGLIAAAAETNSICFDPEGRYLASSISRYHPTIYAVNDPDPLATLHSTVAEDPIEDDYYSFVGIPQGTPSAPKKLSSCCTIKHGSFGLQALTGKLHYAVGSDDFRAYLFEIPDRDELVRRREFVNRHEWIQETSKMHDERRRQAVILKTTENPPRGNATHGDTMEQAAGHHDDDDESDSDSDSVAESQIDHESEIAYSAGSILRAANIVRPARVQQQAYVLCGYRSIVNTALIHPTLPLVFTAGIVSEIQVHSAAPFDAKDVQPENDDDDWCSSSSRRQNNEIGGTRPRFLVPFPRRSLIRYDSDSDAGSEEEDQDRDHDQQDEEGHDPESASSVEGSDYETESNDEVHRSDGEIDAAQGEGQPPQQADVHNFLSAMRQDPMYNTPAALDYHHDRHIGTYSLSHLPRDAIPDESQASSADSDSDQDADMDIGIAADSSTTDSHASDEVNETDDDYDDIDDDVDNDPNDLHSMDGYDPDPYKNDGYGSPTLGFADSEIEERDAQVALDHEEEYEASGNGSMWSRMKAVESSARDQRRMYQFDDLLRRDELRSLTAGFQKVPRFAGGDGQGSGFTCRSCEGSIDTDE